MAFLYNVVGQHHISLVQGESQTCSVVYQMLVVIFLFSFFVLSLRNIPKLMVKSLRSEWSSQLQVRLESTAGSVGIQLTLDQPDLSSPGTSVHPQKPPSLFVDVLKVLSVLNPNFLICVSLP